MSFGIIDFGIGKAVFTINKLELVFNFELRKVL